MNAENNRIIWQHIKGLSAPMVRVLMREILTIDGLYYFDDVYDWARNLAGFYDKLDYGNYCDIASELVDTIMDSNIKNRSKPVIWDRDRERIYDASTVDGNRLFKLGGGNELILGDGDLAGFFGDASLRRL